ncbi:glycoside hydrolase family 12 protein [Macroventuria anomochaeta]|uniref:Glycoside hydrolase family 12 protein n=1 Tax=Macroventuria anomochaeta TaxID=301207 RepID=A0ACB6S2V6_9PLEO|nr:glycoside hydrolase family 12 protein [Macroventuria anomochaeta]KAF2628486.1 glycoside hydrolase family 12 protein [Macroventuria anomochaeta]
MLFYLYTAVANLIEHPADLAARQAASHCGQYSYYAANGYDTSGSGVKWSTTWDSQGGQDKVKSYANVGKQFAKGLVVGNIKSIPPAPSRTTPRDGVWANVAYDNFTAADLNHDKSSSDYGLMVWLARIGGMYPIGNKVTTVNLAGFNWDLYIGPNGSMKVFSFIPADGSWKFTFYADMNVFFNYLAVVRGTP